MITKNQQKIFDQKVKKEKAGVAKSAPIEEVGAVESDHPVEWVRKPLLYARWLLSEWVPE